MPRRAPGRHRLAALIAVLAVVAGTQALLAPGAGAIAGFVPISGSGSTWSSNAQDQWRRAVASLEGITVNYSPNGSTGGRNDFRTGQVDYAVSEIPYGLSDGGVLDPNPSRAFGYMPIVAGGTAFMYNLKIGGKRVTNLRLSGLTLTKIFTQVITNWSDPAIQADNPGLTLPARQIVPVVYSNDSGPTAAFTSWMANQYPALWDDYCHRTGRNITPCGFTSFYPLGPGMEAKAQSQGVAGFVAQDTSEGAITFIEYSYARNAGFPVAKVLNKAGYFVEPTAGNVAVALLQTKIKPDLTADLSQVYVNPDPRAYPLSNYSYMIIPKDTTSGFNNDKGATLSEFAAYFLCEGQQQADPLGYAPLPINLVQAGVDQINQIPGSTHKLDRNNLSGCHNPTVAPDGGNLVAQNAPQPQPCDLQGTTQCGTGTGGAPGPPPTPTPGAGGFVPISGSGSTWSSNAQDQWRRNVASLYGITTNYSPNGSTSGRNDFRTGQVDYAVSEIPYGLSDGGVLDPSPSRAFGYTPIVAGGTAFMYNLKIGNNRVTNLRLSGDTLTKIFTQQITNWSDPAIHADNPGLTLPARTIVPVVYSNGSGTTAQFTAWMANQYPALWDDYCHRTGRNITPCGFTSFYPLGPGMQAKAQSQGVAGFVAQDSSEGAIAFVEDSYARNSGFPVAKVLNKANYYVEPTAGSAAVALLNAKINPDLTADLSQVYVNPDPRTYPLSSYSYMILPKDTSNNFNLEKGKTLSEFAAYFLCEGQQQADTLGYSPLPINLVQAGVDRINQIPGSTHKLDRNNLAQCNNPTVSPDGGNLVAKNAPQPSPCDLKGAGTQCVRGGAPAPTIRLEVTPASPVAVGTTETLTATVTPTPTGQPAVGSVQFQDGTAPLGSAVALSGATASLTTILPSGTHSLTAVFTPPDPTALTSSTSPPVTYVVNAATGAVATTTTLTGSPNPAFPIILRATVTPPTAVGTVEFTDGTTPLAAPIPVIGGTAAVFTPTLTPGTHALTATFIPTDPTTFTPSSSAPMSVAVTTQSLQITTLLHNLLQSLLAGLHL